MLKAIMAWCRTKCDWMLVGLAAVGAVGLSGCGHGHEEGKVASVTEPPAVSLVQPQVKTITRVVGQPSFVESYERTSIYPKVTGYIKKWNVDIGDRVKKNDVLGTLFVPELEEDWETKKATVKLDGERIDLALRRVEVDKADIKAAEARLDEAKAILGQYEAQVKRWKTQVQRLDREVKNGVVDAQVLLESQNQLMASISARDAANATIRKAAADLLSRQEKLAEDKVAVKVARAALLVSQSEAKRLEAWVGYLTLPAPFDGVIVARNANTGDFVSTSIGDPTADHRAPHLAPGNKAAPIYVVDRTDIVRIFVDIPEQDANYVHAGSPASVLIKGYSPHWIPATVTRTAWALNVKSRTLRAEIDTPNHDYKILPGMYAYGKVVIKRPGVRALPLAAITTSGDYSYYYRYENGHAVKTEVQTGVTDGKWIEVTNHRKGKGENSSDDWEPVSGAEQVIVGDLSLLADGAPVRLEQEAEGGK